MPEPTRTQRYEGLFPSQTQEMVDADAQSAAEYDWYPVSETWQGSTLFVVYAQDPGRRSRTASARVPAAAAARGSDAERSGRGPLTRLLIGFVVGIAIVAALAMAMVGLNSWDRPGSVTAKPIITPTPGPSFLVLAQATVRPVDRVSAPMVVPNQQTQPNARTFGDGVWAVGTEIRAGTYRSSGSGTCSWARLKGFGGTPHDIIANDIGRGHLLVTIRSTDAGFTSSGCGTWTRR